MPGVNVFQDRYNIGVKPINYQEIQSVPGIMCRITNSVIYRLRHVGFHTDPLWSVETVGWRFMTMLLCGADAVYSEVSEAVGSSSLRATYPAVISRSSHLPPSTRSTETEVVAVAVVRVVHRVTSAPDSGISGIDVINAAVLGTPVKLRNSYSEIRGYLKFRRFIYIF